MDMAQETEYFLVDGNDWLTYWGRDKIATISPTTFLNALSWMKIYEFRLRFRWSLFLRLELTTFQHWLR